MDISESKGYEKLKDAVERDIKHQLEMALNQNKSFNCHFNKVINKKVCDFLTLSCYAFANVSHFNQDRKNK